MKLKKCDVCGKEDRWKFIVNIKGKFYCNKCKVILRKNHRKETIENSEDKENIIRLTSEIKNKRFNEKKIERKRLKDLTPPKPKGSKKTIVDKNNCYISMQEKQNLFRILLNRGVDGDDAKERIKNLVRSQKELREKMLNQKKSEKEIKIEQSKLLEELWSY